MQKVIQTIKKYGTHIGILIIGLVVGGLAVNQAFASIPDSNGTIHGCRNSITTMLRVIDSASSSCGSDETGLNWDQNGVKGYGRFTYNNTTSEWELDTARSKNISNVVTDPGDSRLVCFTLNSTPHSVSAVSQYGGPTIEASIKDANGWAGPNTCNGVSSGSNVRILSGAGEGIGFFVTLY